MFYYLWPAFFLVSFSRYRSDEFVTAQLSESGDRGRLSLKDWRLFAGVLPGLLVKCPEVNGVEEPTAAETEAAVEQSMVVAIALSASDSDAAATNADDDDDSLVPAVIGTEADHAESSVEMPEMSSLQRHVSRLPGQIRSNSMKGVSAFAVETTTTTTTAVLHAPGSHSSANADADASSNSDASVTAVADSSAPAVIGADSTSASASSSSSSQIDSTAHASPPKLHAPGAAFAAAAAAAGVAIDDDDASHVVVAVAEVHVPAVIGAASSAAANQSAPAASSSLLHAPVGGGVLVSAFDATADAATAAATAAVGGSVSKLRSLHVWESADDTASWQLPPTLAGQLEAAQRCDLAQTVLAFEQLEVDIAFRADQARG